MAFRSFRSIIQPKLKEIEALTPFGLYYVKLAEALNEWFNERLTIQIGSVKGTVTAPNGATVPFAAECLKPLIETLSFQPMILQSYALTEQQLFPNIFNYIGLTINQKLRVWVSVPPINIISNLSVGFITGHFMLYGEKFIARMQTEDPADPEIFNIFWDEFESHLKDAINTTAIAVDYATGVVPGGMFNGTASMRLLSDLGE